MDRHIGKIFSKYYTFFYKQEVVCLYKQTSSYTRDIDSLREREIGFFGLLVRW